MTTFSERFLQLPDNLVIKVNGSKDEQSFLGLGRCVVDIYSPNVSDNSTAAIQLTRATGATGNIEGNAIMINFIDTCARWVYFPSTNVVTADVIIENYFWCSAYDCNGVHPNYMIDKEDSSQEVQNSFIAVNGIYGFNSTTDYWVKSGTSNGLDNSRFDFGPGSQSAIGYQTYTNPETTGGYGSTIINSQCGRNSGTIACNTTINTRSTFNGGTPVFTNRTPISMAITALAAGGTATFYAYHPFVQGNARLALIPDIAGGSIAGMLVDSVTDNSATHANEIKIVLRNVSGAAQTATITMLLIAGIP